MSSVHLLHFPTKKKDFFFSELGPNFTCWRENPYHSWEHQFSIPLYRESRSCYLEIIFGGIFTDTLGNNMPATLGISSDLMNG